MVKRTMIRKIIIEGPDCSGKSTVVERIKNKLRWDSKSLHHLEGDQFSRYLTEYALADKVVFDRSHFSEMVYGALWRGGSPFTDLEEHVLEFLAQKDAIIIFACPSVELLEERYQARSFEQQIKLKELKKARDLFIEKMCEIGALIYGSESYEELDKLIGEVEKRVK